MNPITAVYVRVSSVGQFLENQLPDLQHYCRAHDLACPPSDAWLEDAPARIWKGPGAAWFADKFTGQTKKRPAFMQLMEMFEAGKLDRIVVWRIDRLGRRAGGLVTLFDQFQNKGVNLVSLKDGVDLSTPAGRMIAGVLASMAQFESESMVERQNASKLVTIERQKKAHELHALGWTHEEIGNCVKATPEQVGRMLKKPPGSIWWGGHPLGKGRKPVTPQRVLELANRGLTVAEIANASDISRATVLRRLKEANRQEAPCPASE